mmetsp:Transcript_74364/g.240400  ORF Transcript_74364/g.240400 Transcript_74364/m.240400 type:complete len:330 (-) Transcript_74364:372-1361(-)
MALGRLTAPHRWACRSISWPPRVGRLLSPLRRAAPFASFTIKENDIWRRDLIELTPGVKVRQEATNWEKALPFGLGAVVWQSAVAFCELVEELERERMGRAADASGVGASFWQGKAVLELGAGCGASGLALAAKGAIVTLSDRPALLPLLERNVALNEGLNVSVRTLAWEDAEASDFHRSNHVGETSGSTAKGQRLAFDVVIATDVVEVDPDRRSGEAHFEALRHALSCMLSAAPNCMCLLIFEERGPLKLPALGSLFGPLARDGVLFEFSPPARLRRPSYDRRVNRLRYMCLHGSGTGASEGAFESWRSLLGQDANFTRWHEHDFELE